MDKMKIKDINVNYKYINNDKKDTLVFLHGWGQNIEMMEPLAKFYDKKFNIFIIDFPGFGQSEEPKYAWSVYDYTTCLHEILEKLNIENPILLGHSFGGRISLIYASLYKTKKMILFASPFCKEIKKVPLKTKFYKFVKKTPGLKVFTNVVKNMVGSSDYKNASEIMRQILVKTINQELYDDIKKITCPTLLIWGSNDTAVPLNRAYELEKLIKDSGVIVYEGATHYAYLERINEVRLVLNSFLEV